MVSVFVSDQSGGGVGAGAADDHQVLLDCQQLPAAINIRKTCRGEEATTDRSKERGRIDEGKTEHGRDTKDRKQT